MSVGGEIVAVLARAGYHLRDDYGDYAPPGFVRLGYGKGHWSSGTVDDKPIWLWDGDDHRMPEILLPEDLFTPGHPEADR